MHDPTRSIRGGAAAVVTTATPRPGSQLGERHYPIDPHRDPARFGVDFAVRGAKLDHTVETKRPIHPGPPRTGAGPVDHPHFADHS